MKHGLKSISMMLLITSALLAVAIHAAEDRVYYRYVNEDGVKVLNHIIPPEYVNKGYEVVSLNGQVLKVVEPAPSEAEAEKVARERELRLEQARADKLLRRRYSSVADIKAAKIRGLQELQGNISILNSNLSNVRDQILRQQEQAARTERSGRAVSEELLQNLATLQMEKKDIIKQIKQREQEYQTASDKFDQDMLRFEEITRPAAASSSNSSL